ncbi:bifunctional precorrin-2 dehydrogenase/sirohydrochlorin ferrochelatase [Candidatus Poribacteria bacterium]|nr:bifunctional precorrin-2 dehydrogenase/sirohydrochlorin ferrochelatase [Candidatus Poribacteria bacterium]
MFYPVHLNLQNRKCLVVGGGTVAERKVVAMLISGGVVTVISPDSTELLDFLADNGTIRLIRREYRSRDTVGYFLVCAATNTTSINTSVYQTAHIKNRIALVNVVDVIPQCTFAAASVVTDGEIVISISTSGKSPATSRRIREYLEEKLNVASLYTLGYDYEHGQEKPVPIENQRLPYPVYLLLQNRNCVVINSENTTEIEQRIQLLQRCGAQVKCQNTNSVNLEELEDAFLVISEDHTTIDPIKKNIGSYIYECLDRPAAGTHITPKLVIDDNLIISISARTPKGLKTAERLHKSLVHQFENRGYGKFIDFLGTLRPKVLKTFSTSKERADYFENLIDCEGIDRSSTNTISVSVDNQTDKTDTCCLRLKQTDCNAECLFNWVLQGKLNKASELSERLLT